METILTQGFESGKAASTPQPPRLSLWNGIEKASTYLNIGTDRVALTVVLYFVNDIKSQLFQ